MAPNLQLFPGDPVDAPWFPPWDDPWDDPEDAPAEAVDSDADDGGEVHVHWAPVLLQVFALSDEEEEEEEEDWDDGDSGYGSLEEEEEEEDEDQRVPGQELRAPPAQAVEPVGLPQIPAPQQRAESPSPAFSALQRMEEEALHRQDLGQLSLPAPSRPVLDLSSGPAPDFLPLGGSKRSRDEDDEDKEDDAKRPRLSSSEDSDGPSTSAGTSGGFTRYFLHPHLFQDPDSDSD